ncbi:hypothetical protein KC660_02025 [Candidatus Dojkabacteria bacterium]|uniref:Uncharacterized protein n=1 Tax=Candidatus Dojkabacteria bacterium TaxID=2099670 RepID=A0A955L3F3_9BACT|nr:hypothetical protein [Candidatus Dojkabacteria bacterium]
MTKDDTTEYEKESRGREQVFDVDEELIEVNDFEGNEIMCQKIKADFDLGLYIVINS